jgi:hypothetical protein
LSLPDHQRPTASNPPNKPTPPTKKC